MMNDARKSSNPVQERPDEQAVLIYLHRPRPFTLPYRRVRLRRGQGLRRPQKTASGVLLLPLGEGWVVEVLDVWLASWPSLLEAVWPRLSPVGSLWIRAHPQDAAYLKVVADGLLGRRGFHNELVWVHPARFRHPRRWPETHQVLLGYVKSPQRALFRRESIDRIPYMAPRLVGKVKARWGKLPTDVWWPAYDEPGTEGASWGAGEVFPHRFWERLLQAHTRPGDLVLIVGQGDDLASVAKALGRRCRVLSLPS